MIAVARSSAVAAAVMAGFMLVAALIALLRNEAGGGVFVACAVMTIFGAGAVHLAVRHRAARLDRRAAFALLAVLWAGIPVLAAIPVAATTTLGPMAAWLEAVSAFTTTGPVYIHDIEGVPRATLAWLLTLQWGGGLLTLVGFVAVLGPAGIGGLPDRSARAALLGVSETSALDDALRLVVPIYLGATVIGTFLMFAAGERPFDALALAGAALSTGGLLPDADGMAAHGSSTVKLIFIVLMLIGATSVLWHRLLLTRRFRLALGQQENLALLLLVLVLGIAVAAIDYNGAASPLFLPIALEDGLFTAVALVTTTGVEPHGGAFSGLPITLVAAVVFVGGATFSTAGGIKIYRAGIMLLQSYLELERLIHPNAVRPRRLGQQQITLQMMKAIWIMFGVACTSVAALTMLLAPAMPSFEAAFMAALSALWNVGPIYGAGWETSATWPDWSVLPVYTQIVLIIAMTMGRLEILLVLALANFALWRR